MCRFDFKVIRREKGPGSVGRESFRGQTVGERFKGLDGVGSVKLDRILDRFGALFKLSSAEFL